MVLSDRSIKEQIENGRIVINPLGENSIQPASVDVHLDNRILVFSNSIDFTIEEFGLVLNIRLGLSVSEIFSFALIMVILL